MATEEYYELRYTTFDELKELAVAVDKYNFTFAKYALMGALRSVKDIGSKV